MTAGTALLAATAATTALMFAAWLLYRATDKPSWVDAFWAGNLAVLALGYAWFLPGDPTRRLVVAIVGGLWGARLAAYIAARIIRGPEDQRYVTMQSGWSGNIPARYLRFYMTQAVVDVVLSVPFLLMALDATPFGHPVELVGLALWVISIAGEGLADAQLARFKRDPANRGKVCRTGLWRVSRHPNYFFESLLWCAFALMATPAPWGWVSWSAPVMMLYFLLRVTGVPLAEKQSLASRGEAYRAYQREVSAFVPWFPRRG